MALAKRYDVLVVHDLAYADIVYDGWKAPSIMQVPGARDVAVEFFTLSKSYNMAGWRIGFMVGNKTLVSALARIKSYHDYGTFTPLQVAAIAALEGDQQCVRDIAEQYKRRRDVLVKGLHEAGWMVEMPKASMYVWAKIPEPYAAMGSLEFAKKLLNEAKVCVSPGIGFGDYGDTHVRFALIENRDRIRQAIRGLKRCSVPTVYYPPAANIFTKTRNKHRRQKCKQEPDGSCFSLHSLLLDHQGKSTGPNDDHKRNAHKEIFHFTSLRVITVTPE